MPSIDRNSLVPFYQQVYEQIARGIETGSYPAGKRLPSIRECARELGVSNTTIELAYQRLAEEGYVRARRGSGYVICELQTTPASPLERFTDDYRAHQETLEARLRDGGAPKPAFDFAYDAVDASVFPFSSWARVCRDVFLQKGAEAACLYNDRQGLLALREQVSKYLNGEYGLGCTPEQVLVMPTTRDLIAEITGLFNPEHTVIAMENPGYDEVNRRLAKSGFEVRNMPVFPYPAWEETRLALEGARIVFATPASQFPSNQPMAAGLRENLVGWAQQTDAYLIDDEYGWEFQSGVSRTPPLAAIDNAGRVITMGTFSNSLAPAVCLSYAVLPPQLMLRWLDTAGGHPQVPWQTQAAMAAFMREGLWRSHVRKIRTAMQEKRRLLVEALRFHLGESFEIVEAPSSLFALVQARDGRGEQELLQAAAREGVRVYPTSQYWNGEVDGRWRYVLVGYAGIPADRIRDGVKALARAWETPGPGKP